MQERRWMNLLRRLTMRNSVYTELCGAICELAELRMSGGSVEAMTAARLKAEALKSKWNEVRNEAGYGTELFS